MKCDRGTHALVSLVIPLREQLMREQHKRRELMDEHQWLAEQFEAERSRLRAVAYRMLGSPAEAEGALQENWPPPRSGATRARRPPPGARSAERCRRRSRRKPRSR